MKTKGIMELTSVVWTWNSHVPGQEYFNARNVQGRASAAETLQGMSRVAVDVVISISARSPQFIRARGLTLLD